MVDQAFEQIATHLVELCNTYVPELLNSSAFPELSAVETQITCIKIALEAFAVALAIWLGNRVRVGSKKKNATEPSRKQTQSKKEIQMKYGSGKKFTPPKWRTDGYYWDDKKQKWIAPDFKIKEKD